MELNFDPYKQTGLLPMAGRILIAEPYLNEPTFSRTVIYLTEHNEAGSVGFLLNKPAEVLLEDLLPEMPDSGLPVFNGGPVQVDSLHLVHRDFLAFGGTAVADRTYWGGSFEALQSALVTKTYHPEDVRLFVGYSGWSAGQLEAEIASGAWLVAEVDSNFIFNAQDENMWRAAIESLGSEFKYLSNLPIDPTLN